MEAKSQPVVPHVDQSCILARSQGVVKLLSLAKGISWVRFVLGLVAYNTPERRENEGLRLGKDLWV